MLSTFLHTGHSDTSPGACNSALQPRTACLKQRNLHENLQSLPLTTIFK